MNAGNLMYVCHNYNLEVIRTTIVRFSARQVAYPIGQLVAFLVLFCHHASLLMIVSIIEHLITPLFLSQTVRSQLLVTSAMYKRNTLLSIL